MEERNDTWENLTSKKSEFAKSYGLNSAQTVICHLHAHELVISKTSSNFESISYLTVGTFDRDFIILENRGFAQMMKDVEYKEVLRVRTNYPIMHCVLEYHFEAKQNVDLLVGYLIDIYSSLYTVNFSKAIDIALKFPKHPIQFSCITQTFRRESSLP
jgi:hypothetical protein